jgi:hypothetical protein
MVAADERLERVKHSRCQAKIVPRGSDVSRSMLLAPVKRVGPGRVGPCWLRGKTYPCPHRRHDVARYRSWEVTSPAHCLPVETARRSSRHLRGHEGSRSGPGPAGAGRVAEAGRADFARRKFKPRP